MKITEKYRVPKEEYENSSLARLAIYLLDKVKKICNFFLVLAIPVPIFVLTVEEVVPMGDVFKFFILLGGISLVSKFILDNISYLKVNKYDYDKYDRTLKRIDK